MFWKNNITLLFVLIGFLAACSPDNKGSYVKKNQLDQRPNSEVTFPTDPTSFSSPSKDETKLIKNENLSKVTRLLDTSYIFKCIDVKSDWHLQSLLRFELDQFDDIKVTVDGNYDQIINLITNELKKSAPFKTLEIIENIHQFKSAQNHSLSSYNSEGLFWLPEGCQLIPAAVLAEENGTPIFYQEPGLIEMLDAKTKAAIHLQMAFSKLARVYRPENYLGSRRISRQLFNKTPLTYFEISQLFLHLTPNILNEYPFAEGDSVFISQKSMQYVLNRFDYLDSADEVKINVACGYFISRENIVEKQACELSPAVDLYEPSTNFHGRLVKITEQQKIKWLLDPKQIGFPESAIDYSFQYINGNPYGYWDERIIKIKLSEPTIIQKSSLSYLCPKETDIEYYFIYPDYDMEEKNKKFDLQSAENIFCDSKKEITVDYKINQQNLKINAKVIDPGQFEVVKSGNDGSLMQIGKLKIPLIKGTTFDSLGNFKFSKNEPIITIGANAECEAKLDSYVDKQLNLVAAKNCILSKDKWKIEILHENPLVIDTKTLSIKKIYNANLNVAKQKISNASLLILNDLQELYSFIDGNYTKFTYYLLERADNNKFYLNKTTGAYGMQGSSYAFCYDKTKDRLIVANPYNSDEWNKLIKNQPTFECMLKEGAL